MIINSNFSSLSIKEPPPAPRDPIERTYPFIKKIRLPKGKRLTVNRILALRRTDILYKFKINNISLNENLVVDVSVCKNKKKENKEDISIIKALPIKEINKKDFQPNTKIKCNQYLQISYTNTEATGIIEVSGEYKRIS